MLQTTAVAGNLGDTLPPRCLDDQPDRQTLYDENCVTEEIGIQIPEGTCDPGKETTVPGILVHSIEDLLSNGEEDDPEYKGDVDWLSLEDNIWDLALLVGLRHSQGLVICVWRSIAAVLLLIINVLIQFGFVLAVSSSLSTDGLNTSTWHGIGGNRLKNHEMSNFDSATLKSRAEGLCKGSIYSFTQDFYSMIATYLQRSVDTKGVFDLPGVPGRAVATLATMIWILSMTMEARRILEIGCAILAMPTARSFKEPSVEDDHHTVVRLCKMHKAAYFCFVLTPRLLTCILLLSYGVDWLALTYNVSDIIVNACALEIVKNIDELLFFALLGRRTKRAISSTRFTWHSRSKGNEKVMLFGRFLFVACLTTYVSVTKIRVRRERIEQFSDLLCGGDVAFVGARDFETGMPVFADTTVDPTDTTAHVLCIANAASAMYAVRAGYDPDVFGIKVKVTNQTVIDVIRGTHEACHSGSPQNREQICPAVRLDEVATVSSPRPPWHRRCQDYPVLMNLLHEVCVDDDFGRALFGNVTTCEDFKPFCNAKPADLERDGISPLLHSKVEKLCTKTCNLQPCTHNKTGLRRLEDAEWLPPRIEESGPDGAPLAARLDSLGPIAHREESNERAPGRELERRLQKLENRNYELEQRVASNEQVLRFSLFSYVLAALCAVVFALKGTIAPKEGST